MSPKQDTFRRNLSVIITYHKTTIREIAYRNPGDETLCKARFIPVRCSKGICKPHDMHIVMPPGSLSEGNGFWPEFFAEFIQSRGNFLKNFIPGDTFPLSASPLSLPAKRLAKTVGMVCNLRGHNTLNAHPALIHRRSWVSFDPHHLAVFNKDQDAASAVTNPANTPENLLTIPQCYQCITPVRFI